MIRNLDAARGAAGRDRGRASTASPQSFYGLKLGIALGKALHRPVHAVAVYDPYLHYAMFNGIVGVLTEQASKVFRFKEQEQLHEEIIDTGLAKIYQSHLEIGRKLAADEGVDLAITLLDGKCFEKVLQFCRKEQPWLLILGRIGVHSDEREADLGSNTENLLRLAPCNVLLVGGQVLPAARRQGRGDHRLDGRGPRSGWSACPQQVAGRGPDRAAPLRDRAGAHRHHHKVIDEAMAIFMPSRMAEKMQILAEDLAVAKLRAEDAAVTAICSVCGYMVKGPNPVVKCPVCSARPGQVHAHRPRGGGGDRHRRRAGSPRKRSCRA